MNRRHTREPNRGTYIYIMCVLSYTYTTKFVFTQSCQVLQFGRNFTDMKFFAIFFLLVTFTSGVYSQTCLCSLPVEGELCAVITPDSLGTCKTVTQPCSACRCDAAGTLTCEIVQAPSLFFNSSGSGLCSLRDEPLVKCPSSLPEVFTTCCTVAGEGSSLDVPCSLQNYRDFQPAGKTLVSARTVVETNVSLVITAINTNPATPGPWFVSYISEWTFNFQDGLPIYFQNFLAYDITQTGTIPAGTPSEEITVARTSTQNDQLTPELFADLVSQTGTIDFLASYVGVSEGSNTQSIIASFGGTPCLEYTFQ